MLPALTLFLGAAGLSDMTDEQMRSQLVRLVIASTLLPWGWLFLRTSIVLGMLGIIQIVAVGYGTFRANRFFRPRLQRIVPRLLVNFGVYCLLCSTTNAVGAALVLVRPSLVHASTPSNASRLNFVVQHLLGVKEALIGCFVAMTDLEFR